MRGYRICIWMSASACWRRFRKRPRRDLESITPPCNWSERDCRRNRDTLCRSRQKIKIEERAGEKSICELQNKDQTGGGKIKSPGSTKKEKIKPARENSGRAGR